MSYAKEKCFLLLAFVFSAHLFAAEQDDCTTLLTKAAYGLSPQWGSRAPEEVVRPAFLSEPKAKKKWKGKETLEKAAEASIPAHDRADFQRYVQGQYYEDGVVVYEDNFLGPPKNYRPSAPHRYNREGERPFEGYVKAVSSLEEVPVDRLNLSTLSSTHKTLMSPPNEQASVVLIQDGTVPKNSQGLRDEEMGVYRDETPSFLLSKPEGQDWQVPGSKKPLMGVLAENPYLKHTKGSDRVKYAPLSDWKKFSTEISPQTREKILELERAGKDLDSADPEVAQVRSQYVQDLVQASLNRLQNGLKNASTNADVIGAVANFHREFVSIHPFTDGNGRMARLLTQKILGEYGMPPPLWTRFGEDVAVSRKAFTEILENSVADSQKYHQDLQRALECGISYGSIPSPVLANQIRRLFPGFDRFDAEEFLEWSQRHRREHEDFPSAVTAYRSWKKGHDYSFQDVADALGMVPDGFTESFGRLSPSEEAYQWKKDRYYSALPAYRGTPVDHFPTSEEVALWFTQQTQLTRGNGMDPSATSPRDRMRFFAEYNNQFDRHREAWTQRIEDHSKEGPGYATSGGLSVSAMKEISERWRFFVPSALSSQGESQKVSNVVGVLFETKQRKQGAVHTYRSFAGHRQMPVGYAQEYESVYIGGIDPEMIDGVSIGNSDHADKRYLVARRLSYNRISIRMDLGQGPKEELWEYATDGTVKKIH